jgi:hypothetical protein
VALFLASDDSSFVTGTELFVGGGKAQIYRGRVDDRGCEWGSQRHRSTFRCTFPGTIPEPCNGIPVGLSKPDCVGRSAIAGSPY